MASDITELEERVRKLEKVILALAKLLEIDQRRLYDSAGVIITLTEE